jgi:hypothetical protein
VVKDLTTLQNIPNNSSGNFMIGQNINASDTSRFGSGFYNGGQGFMAITGFSGSLINPFKHQIISLTINRPNQDFVGLIGSAYGATINGVKLTNVNITGQNYVGGLVGYATNTQIINSIIIKYLLRLLMKQM